MANTTTSTAVKTGIVGTLVAVATVVALKFGTSTSTVVVTTQKEFFDACRAAETQDIAKIELGVPVMFVDSGIRLTGNIFTRSKNLIIDLNGGSIVANSDTIRAILYRRPKDQTEALNVFQSQSITLVDGAIIGKNGKSIGFEYCAGYGGGVKNVKFSSLAEAAHFRFVLMGLIEQCFATNCAKYGFTFDNGDWVGAALANAQSNHCIARQCRVFNADGAIWAFASLGASGCTFDSDISEGGKPRFHFYHNALTSTVCKDYTARSLHLESPCDSAGMKIVMFGGIATIDKVFSQYDMTLIDASDPISYPHIHVSNIPFMTTKTRFKTGGNNVVWTVSDVIAIPSMIDTSRWIGGVKPYYLSELNFNQSPSLTASVKYNGKTIVTQ